MNKKPDLKSVPSPEESAFRITAIISEIQQKIFYPNIDENDICQLGPINFLGALEEQGIFEKMVPLIEAERSQIFGAIFQNPFIKLNFDQQKAVKERFKMFLEAKSDIGIDEFGFKKKKTALTHDYVTLFEELYPGAARCKLAGTMKFFDPITKRWTPVRNQRCRAITHAHDRDFYAPTKIKEQMDEWIAKSTPKLLIEIPEWDGRDRIEEVVRALSPGNMDQASVYGLILDWGVKMIRRIEDPWVRNRILIFQGGQDIGKDWLIDALVGGLWAPGLGYVRSTRVDDTGEIDLKLHLAAVFIISEFDKTSKVAVSQLKDIITKAEGDERLKYAEEAEGRPTCPSFIASANPKDLLRDVTGNTRFIIVELSGGRGTAIDFSKPYPGLRDTPDFDHHRKQIIAQYKHYASTGFKASAHTENILEEYISGASPEDPALDLAEFWDEWATDKVNSMVSGHRETIARGWIFNRDMKEFYIEAMKQFKLSRQEIQRRLAVQGLRKKSDGLKGYSFNYIKNTQD